MNKNPDLDRIVYFLDGLIVRKDTYRNFIYYLTQYYKYKYKINTDFDVENKFDIFESRLNPCEEVLISSRRTYEEAENYIFNILEFEVYNGDVSTYRNIHHWETREEIPDFLNKGKHLD